MTARSRLIWLAGLLVAGASAAAAEDAYAPLGVYAGKWSVVTSRGKTLTVVNACVRTGLFYVCEQSIDGAPKSLVVFRPTAGDDNGHAYRTQTLGADGAEPGHWFSLRIRDADWVYAPEGADPKTRTLNHVIDADHIRFEVQKKQGEAWKTISSGLETRVK